MSEPLPPVPARTFALLGRLAPRRPPAVPPPTLAELAREFVALKRLLGHRYDRPARDLRHAMAFLETHGIRLPHQFSAAALAAYAATRRHLAARTWRGTLESLSVFADHLCALGWIPTNPCPSVRRPDRLAFRPYIFSRDELARLFALEARHPRAADRVPVYRTLYAGALRRSEALRLRLRHFDSREGTLVIENTKFGKSRLVPLAPAVAARLALWVESRRHAAPADAPLFVNAAGRAFRANKFEERFRGDLSRAAIPHVSRIVDGVRYGAPCLHSLRHSFAVHRLLQWYRQGADVQAKLWLLSTFLGHSQVRHTQVYLTITRALLEEGRRRFSARWEKEFRPQP